MNVRLQATVRMLP